MTAASLAVPGADGSSASICWMNELISGMMLVIRVSDLKMAARFIRGSSEDDAASPIGVEALGSTDTLGALTLGQTGGGSSPSLLVGTVGAIAGDDDEGVGISSDGVSKPFIRFRIRRKTFDRVVLITRHRRNWLDQSLR